MTEGLRREIREECGIEVELGRLAHVRSNLSSCIVIFCFHATYVVGELRPSEETPEVRWADEQTALELITHPALHLTLRDMLADDGQALYQAYRSNPYVLVEERAI
ncbi:MAG: hypothetical protein OXG78_01500 [Chloroflexi bacterium]|nr:hypothetical protein [Chloroflexota bacterium]